MKRRWWIPLLFLSLGLNVGLLVVRFLPRRPPPPPPIQERLPLLEEHLSRMTEHLGLSDAQRGELRAVYEKVFPDLVACRSRVREARGELETSYQTPSLNLEALRERLERLVSVQAEFDALMTETIVQEAAILSADQRRLYIERMPWKGATSPSRQPPPPGAGHPPPPGGKGPPPPPPPDNT